jgi:peptidoglycan-N-acetylglucosamine deacetylase
LRKVVLTFDDGPDPTSTPRILDALATQKVQATFFVIGQRLTTPGSRDILRRAASEGHLIGNHTFSHPNLINLPAEEIRWQIVRTHELIAEFEPKRKLFRPPFGACDARVSEIAEELGYQTVFWNASSEDWKAHASSGDWVELALEGIARCRVAILLCHDFPSTAEHLPLLLQKVQRLPERRIVRHDRSRSIYGSLKFLGQRARTRFRRSLGESSLKEGV